MLGFVQNWRHGKQYGYEALFKHQDTRPKGKVGVILADMGMPETFEPTFYCSYMDHVFRYALPSPLQRIVLVDRGIVLIDPHNPLAREPFAPRQLVDMHGASTNKTGRPYAECQVTWCPPGMKKNPWDHGHFLYREEGPGGAPDICQKTAAKVVGWYYGHLLPEKKVAWAYQCGRVYEEAVAALQEQALQGHIRRAEFRHARYVYENSLRQAVEELLAADCRTIIYQCFCNPIYSDFEDYGYALPRVHEFVARRAQVICADQLGSQPAMRQAYLELLRDQLKRLPHEASIYLILSTHGHPFRRETQIVRAPEYRYPLEAGARALLAQRGGGRWNLAWADDEYADPYWDPRHIKLSALDAYRQAIEQGYDYVLELTTDFMAENTDLMFAHAMRKYVAFSDYDPHAPVPYPDWEQPLVRVFHRDATTGIYLGCPVGPYRRYVVEAVVASVSQILRQRE
jgi:protoheme ferro-lyase